MANNLPTIRKAFLATRSVSSGVFLMTERFEADSGQTLFYIIESSNDKFAKVLQNYFQSDLVKSFMSAAHFSLIHFEECLHFVNKKLASGKDTETRDKVSALVGLLEENTLHLAMTGSIEGYLLRKGKINSLTEGLDTEEDAGFYNITSGSLALSDLVIIGNKNIFNRLSLDRIRRTLNQFTPREAIRDFYQILRKSKNLDCNAAIFQAISPLASEKEVENLPDLLYLDEIIESSFSKFSKKIKPVISEYYNKLSKVAGSASAKSKEIAQKSSTQIKEKYAPSTKSLLMRTNSKAALGLTKLAQNIKGKGSVKIKPYSKHGSADSPEWLEKLTKFSRAIFTKQNRRYLYVVLVLILLFAAFYKIRANNQNRDVVTKQNEATYSYEKATETFNQAKEDMGLGKSDGVDKITEAMSLAITAKDSPITKDKAVILIKDIQTKIDELSKTKRIYDAKPIFSFKYDIVTSVISGSTIYGLTEDGKIYSTDSRDKSPKLVAAVPQNLGKPISGTYSDTMSLIFFLTDKSKIWGYDEQTQSGTEIVLDDGGSWETADAIVSYSTYLYLLDNQSGKIWRHTKSGDKFSAGKTYAAAKNTDAKDGLSIAIDGAIFVLKPQGVVAKFSHSIPDPSFVLQSPPKPDISLAGATEIYTDSDSQNIFILDKIKGRVVRYAKDGQFVDQYVLDQISINEMLLNPRIQKLWLLSGKDVYELDL